MLINLFDFTISCIENNMIRGSMTSLLSQAATGPQLTFLYPMTLQLCRFGMEVCVYVVLCYVTRGLLFILRQH